MTLWSVKEHKGKSDSAGRPCTLYAALKTLMFRMPTLFLSYTDFAFSATLSSFIFRETIHLWPLQKPADK